MEVQDIQRVYKKNITLSSSGAVSDGHVPMTHHRANLSRHNAHVLSSLPFPERSLINEAHCFVAQRHLAALSQS